MCPDNEAALDRLVATGRYRDREDALDAIVSYVRDEDARKLERLRERLRSAGDQEKRGELLSLESDEELGAFFESLKHETQAKSAAS